jgi:hypothetical protein
MEEEPTGTMDVGKSGDLEEGRRSKGVMRKARIVL